MSGGPVPDVAAAEAEIAAEATLAGAEVAPVDGDRARSHPVLRAFLRAPGGVIGATIFIALIVLAIIGPPIWGHEATTTDLAVAYQKHSAAHPLGTDSLGRDMLARTLAATRLTLELGLFAAAISAGVGFGLGTLVASLGPRARAVGRRAIEISMSFPPILLALFLVTIIGTGAKGAVIAIGLGAAPGFARLAENYATSVGSKEFVASARATGVGRGRLITRYLLPNMAEPLVLAGLAYFAGSIIDISGLDYLGVGVQTPSYDWGTLLTTGVQSIYVTPWAAVAPAVMITITGMAIVYMGEAIARALNPRLWFAGAHHPRSWRRLGRSAAPPAAANVDPGATDADVVLDVEGLEVLVPSADGPRALVRGVSLRLRAGEVLGIVGETGSGKTLTALSLARLVPHPLRTQIARHHVDGTDVGALPARRREQVLGTSVAMIFQNPMSSMNPSARIGSQLTDGARRHRALSRAAARDEAIARLGEVRIGDATRALRRYPHQFSGGMQQRIMIAMGLMARPKVLLADEPTTALDVTVQAQVLEVLRDVKEREKTAIVLISHNLGVVNQLCDRVMVMYAGRVVEEGPRERLLRRPRHPYTQGLLGSIPELTADTTEDLQAIPGRPPAAGETITGCSFAPRCPLVQDRCRAAEPPLTTMAPDDRVACFGRRGGERVVSLLEVTDVRVRYGRGRTTLTAVDGVSLTVDAGASLGIVGESGSGKSTLARAIVQIVPTASGSIVLDGRDVTNAGGSDLRHVRDRAQIVFQDPFASLNPRMTVGATLDEAIRLRGRGDGAGRGARRAEIRELLELVTLPGTLDGRYPSELSGGQLQRVCIARALAGKPSLLILDEVTSALDVSVQAAILNLLRELRRELGLTYVCISHDLSVISYLCERVMVLYLGQAVEIAGWSELLGAPRHPYTRTLLDSVPQVHGDVVRATAGGDLPDPRRPPSGCRFHTRCPVGPRADPQRTRCVAEDPHADPGGADAHLAACHFPLNAS